MKGERVLGPAGLGFVTLGVLGEEDDPCVYIMVFSVGGEIKTMPGLRCRQ